MGFGFKCARTELAFSGPKDPKDPGHTGLGFSRVVYCVYGGEGGGVAWGLRRG